MTALAGDHERRSSICNGQPPHSRLRRAQTQHNAVKLHPGAPAASVSASAEIKREAVIRAAAHAAFNRKGYHNTSLDDIAAALDVTKPTVYYYVTSKEQLLFECFVAGVEQHPGGVPCRQNNRKVTGRERLASLLRHYGEAVASEFGWCMVRAEEQDLSPDHEQPHQSAEVGNPTRASAASSIEGIQDGSIHPCDPKMTAFALAGALNWIAHWYRENPGP